MKSNIIINTSNISFISVKQIFGIIILLSLFTVVGQVEMKAQCGAQATEVCTGVTLGATFSAFDAGISGATSCGLGTGNAGFIVLNVGTTGILNLVVNGSATTGFIDVAIFNIPPGEDPCVAATVSANELSCNYAASSVGCAGFGNVAAICGATITGPTVSIGDRIIVVVDNYSGSAVTYDVQMYDNAGNPVNTTNGDNNGSTGADVGVPEADIGDITLCPNDVPTQVPNSGDYDGDGLPNAGGGTWSGAFVDTDGLFDPVASGSGSFTVTYSHDMVGADCYNTDDATVTVVTATTVPDAVLTCPSGDIALNAGLVSLNPMDNNATGAAVTWTGTGTAFVDAVGNFDPTVSGTGSFVVNYELQTATCSSSATCNINVTPLITNLDSDANGTLDISDPCSCGNPLNPDASIVGPGGGVIFYEVVTVTSGAGEIWNMTAGTTDALDATGLPLALPAPMVETSPGIYTIVFYHEIVTGYTGEFNNGTFTENIANTCTVSCPTLGEWGLIIFTLLMLNMVVLFALRRRKQLAVS